MNIFGIFLFQKIVVSIVFILSGIYLVLFLIKEIFYLFFPPKQVQELTQKFLDDNNSKVIKYSSPKEHKNKERKSRKSRKKEKKNNL